MSEHVYVVLVEPEFSGNIGFIARVMMNFNFQNLILVNPRVGLDDTAYIFASHAGSVLDGARIVSSLDEIVSEFDFLVGTTSKVGGDYNVLRVPITPRQLAESLIDVEGKVALLFGRESIGLTNRELGLCDVVVTIPSSEVYPVLNVSHAVAIILYELYVSGLRGRGFSLKFREASRVEKEFLLKYFDRLLEAVDYPEYKRRIARTIFRHVIGRSFISGREAHTLMGVFRSVLVRLGFSF